MKRIGQIMFLVCMLSFSSGCATILQFTDDDDIIESVKKPPCYSVYSLMRVDLGYIYLPILFYTPWGKDGGSEGAGLVVVAGPFMIVCGIVDLPVAFIVDTATLPRDLSDRKRRIALEHMPKQTEKDSP